MVATRRGVRVYSPTKTSPDQTSDVQATPSTGRRTRNTAKQAESSTHRGLVEVSSQLEKHEASPPPSTLKRCTRASRLHSPEQPCTPVGSTYEADMSDADSCSLVSDSDLPVTRSRRGRRAPKSISQEDEEISEVESCSSFKASQSSRRSTRKKTNPKHSDPDVESGNAASDLPSESQRVTRSQRKTRSSAKPRTMESELSDADSCVSSVSGVDESTTRRSRRSIRQTGPIPIHLDESSERSESPARRTRARVAARGKPATTASASQSCDSDGFESGPTYSMATPSRAKTPRKATDSDSELTDAHSQVGSPTRSRGTPCSSRTGSASSSRSTQATRSSVRACSIVLKKAQHPAQLETSLNNSTLESTVIFEEADCTLLEEDETQTSEKEKEGEKPDLPSNEADTKSPEKGVIVIDEVSEKPDSPCAEEAVGEPAVTVGRQQEELRDENIDQDISEEAEMQETILESEPLRPCEPDTETSPAPEITEEAGEKDGAMEVADVDPHPPQEEEKEVVETGPEEKEVVETGPEEKEVVETGPEEKEVVETGPEEKEVVETWPEEKEVVETGPEEEEEQMEVSSVNTDTQQVVESIQVSSSQQPSITVDSDPEPQPQDVVIQTTKVISLLDSSEDEEEGSEVSADEEEEEQEADVEFQAEERAGPSKKCEAAAAASVDGLFMIDTRPGQEANEQYFKEKPTEQEGQEEDEEFVDEEEDDDDDEDAEILFSGRDPHLKELSSRIDPGIRVKELGGLYINFDGSKSKPVSSSLQKLKEKKIQDEVMKKSVMGPDFAKKDAVPPYSESKQALKLKRKAEREKTTGDGWFDMKAPEVTQELKGDLQVLRMRRSMDPKRFYKKNDREGFPKYFQVGTVMDSAVDFYHSRIPKKERKRTMVEELLSDAEFRMKNKKKYQEIQAERAAQGAGRRNKRKKFHKK